VSDAGEIRRLFPLNNGACEAAENAETGRADVRCELGDMIVDERVQILVTGLVDPALAAGSILENSVTVSGTSDDPDAANNGSSLATAITTVANLTVEYAVSNPAPAIGDEIVYTAQVQNGGPLAWAQADNTREQVSAAVAVVVITCPADLNVQQFRSNLVQLVAGEAVTFTLQVENLGPGIASGVVVTGEIRTSGLFDVLVVNPDVYGERDQASCARG